MQIFSQFISKYKLETGATQGGIKFIRTPDSCFLELLDYPFQPNYFFFKGLRMHYVDENPNSEKIVVILHGEPAWSYLFRHTISALAKEGYRVIAPDWLGFGKSDKPLQFRGYSYQMHVESLEDLVFNHLGLSEFHLVVHDWGGLIGLRTLARFPHKIKSVVASNTAFPRAEGINWVFMLWRYLVVGIYILPLKYWLKLGTKKKLTDNELRGYTAPFPNNRFLAGAVVFPWLVPVWPFEKETKQNKKYWETIKKFDKPFITIYSHRDHFSKTVEQQFISSVKGCHNLDHKMYKNKGHFLPEDLGFDFAKDILDFYKKIGA